jgi:hypothetical protein
MQAEESSRKTDWDSFMSLSLQPREPVFLDGILGQATPVAELTERAALQLPTLDTKSDVRGRHYTSKIHHSPYA